MTAAHRKRKVGLKEQLEMDTCPHQKGCVLDQKPQGELGDGTFACFLALFFSRILIQRYAGQIKNPMFEVTVQNNTTRTEIKQEADVILRKKSRKQRSISL